VINMTRKARIWISAALISLAAVGTLAAAGHGPSTDAAQALQMLLAGNDRFVSSQTTRPNQNKERREEVAKGQHPFAVILSCSDSRVPPEIVFDQGLGDLFVVRLAGNVADPVAVESIDYAVKHLGARLVMVLGHDRCGAVTAAVEGHEEPGDMGPMLAELRPAVTASKGKPGDAVANAIRSNVELTVEKLKNSKPLRQMVQSGELKIVGGIYRLDTGKVDLLD
jgi:carbonic anhydrase